MRVKDLLGECKTLGSEDFANFSEVSDELGVRRADVGTCGSNGSKLAVLELTRALWRCRVSVLSLLKKSIGQRKAKRHTKERLVARAACDNLVNCMIEVAILRVGGIRRSYEQEARSTKGQPKDRKAGDGRMALQNFVGSRERKFAAEIFVNY
jgi:hypothetical protein